MLKWGRHSGFLVCDESTRFRKRSPALTEPAESAESAESASVVEAFYKNDVSKILLNESLKAARDFFNGKYFNSNTTGESLKSYLDFVNANPNNQKLSEIINNQFAIILSVNNNLNDSFSTQISNDNLKMIASYDALQRNVIFTKIDMMQALNVKIDYVDSDGD